MDWFAEHIRMIVVVGGAIAYWLSQRRKAREEAEATRTMTSTSAPQTQVNDDAERVRRIQEEIRRKILERAGGNQANRSQPRSEPVRQPVAVSPPMPTPKAQPVVEDAYAGAEEAPLSEIDQSVLERQQLLAAKLRELEEARRQASGKAEAFAEKTTEALEADDEARRGSLLADLRNPVSVRRAVVLREVLGTPVGLR